jgi:23S rRNA (pseudouridine1915-N3)-methyltransferase
MIKIICVGKTTEFDEKIKYYNDRLNGIFQTKIQTINISEQNQSVKILSLLKSNEYIILLDERGEEINNMKLKDIICNFSHNLVFVIGGPFGVNEEVRKRANFI